MAISSDNDNGDKESLAEQLPSSPASEALLNGNLNRSDQIGFTENVFNFVATEGGYLWKDLAEKEMAYIFRADRDKQKLKEKAKAAEEMEEEEEAVVTVPQLAEKEGKAVPEVSLKHAQAEEKSGLRAPNSGNGLDLENYSWSQILQAVIVDVPVPKGTEGRFVVCDIKKNHLKVGLKGQPPIIEGELFQNVKPSDCSWSIEDRSDILILLAKHNQMEWWKCVIKGEPEIDIQKVVPESISSPDFDPETGQIAEKFDQGEKSMDQPIPKEILKPMILELMEHYFGSSSPESSSQ